MKKSILLAIAILMMIFGITTNVYAEECTTPYRSSVNSQLTSLSSTINLGQNILNKKLANNETFKFNNGYIKGKMWYILPVQNYIVSNINLETTCSADHLENMAPTMTITYADGSHATIAGSTYEQICDSWQTRQVNTNISIKSIGEITTINMRILNGSNGYTSCETDLNGNFICPTSYDLDYNGFAFIFSLSGTSSTTVQYGLETGQFKNCISDTQQIINNQNQNSTTISNNITNLNDNILNSSLNSNTSSDASNIGANDINSGSKNVILDFMLMPITFIQNLLNSFDNTCATLCIGNCGSGHDNDWRFVFPCIDLQSILGSTVYNLIDLLMTFGMVFAFVRSVVGFLKKALLLENDISSEVRIF